jgi:hypothetical protein
MADKVLAVISQKKNQKEFVAKIFDDIDNTNLYAINDAIYEINISNSIEFDNEDLLRIEITNVNGNKIEGIATKYKRSSRSETIIWI